VSGRHSSASTFSSADRPSGPVVSPPHRATAHRQSTAAPSNPFIIADAALYRQILTLTSTYREKVVVEAGGVAGGETAGQ
jgi:hypothetical protein